MVVFTFLSVIAYILLWRVPRIGKYVTAILVILQLVFYAHTIVPTASFYAELIERNTGVKFLGAVDVRWGWASRAFAFPNIFSDRAVDVLMVSEVTDTRSIRKKLEYSSAPCSISSAKARALYGSDVMTHCWKGISSSGRDEIYLAASHDYKILYFWQR